MKNATEKTEFSQRAREDKKSSKDNVRWPAYSFRKIILVGSIFQNIQTTNYITDLEKIF